MRTKLKKVIKKIVHCIVYGSACLWLLSKHDHISYVIGQIWGPVKAIMSWSVTLKKFLKSNLAFTCRYIFSLVLVIKSLRWGQDVLSTIVVIQSGQEFKTWWGEGESHQPMCHTVLYSGMPIVIIEGTRDRWSHANPSCPYHEGPHFTDGNALLSTYIWPDMLIFYRQIRDSSPGSADKRSKHNLNL